MLAQRVSTDLVIGIDALLVKLQQLTRLKISNITLVVSERGPFWFVIISDPTKSNSYHCLLDSHGHTARIEDFEYLCIRMKSVFNTSARITFQGREDIISLLLRKGEVSQADICRDTVQSEADVSSSLATLQSEGLVRIDAGSVGLNLDIRPYLQLVSMCLNSSLEGAFIVSDYHARALETIVPGLIEARFRIRLSTPEFEMVKRILLLSPRAIQRVSTEDVTPYVNHAEQVKTMAMSQEKLESERVGTCQHLLGELVLRLITDWEDRRCGTACEKQEIILWKLDTNLRIARERQPFLKIQTRQTIVQSRLEKGESIKAGQFAYGGPGLFFGIATALMAIDDYDAAIESFMRIIRDFPASDAAGASVHNLGNCYLAKGQPEAAMHQFEQALDSEITRKLAMGNLVRTYAQLDRHEQAQKMLEAYRSEFGAEGENRTSLGDQFVGESSLDAVLEEQPADSARK